MEEQAEPIACKRALPSRGIAMAFLVLVSLLSFLPGLFAIPPVDRDEARFAQATRQMVESGDYITPRLGEEPRYKKPIGIYWLQAGVVVAAGPDAVAEIGYYRLPSFAAAVLSVIVTYLIGLSLFGPPAALIGAFLLAAAPLLGFEAHLAKTDAVNMLAALLCQLVLVRFYMDRTGSPRRLAPALLFWGAMGVGILVKGPIVPMLSGLTVIALLLIDRKAGWLRGLRPGIGIPLMLIIVLPWLIAVLLHSGGDFFRESIGHDLLGKVSTGQESHGKPPGWHLLTGLLTYWPGSFVVIAAVPWIWRNRRDAAVRFCLAWLVPFWIAFELIVTKLPHYTLPAAPAAFLMAGAAVTATAPAFATGWRRIVLGLAAGLGLVLALALPVAFRWYQSALPSLPAFAVATLALAAGGLALHRLARGETRTALGLLATEAAIVQALLFGLLMPQADRFWIAPRAAETLGRLNICHSPHILVAGMNEASMLFALGKDITFGDGAAAAAFLDEPECRIVLLAAPQKPAFKASLAARGKSEPGSRGSIDGFNLGSGKWIALDIMTNAPR